MAKDTSRIEPLLSSLRTLWEQCPGLQLGQLLVALSGAQGLAQIEDEELLRRIETVLEKGFPETAETLCPICKTAMWGMSPFTAAYACPKCKATLIDGKWDIPEPYAATEKQIKTAEFITKKTGRNAPPPTKKELWKFIHDHLDEAVAIAKKEYNGVLEQLYGEDPDLFPDYGDLC